MGEVEEALANELVDEMEHQHHDLPKEIQYQQSTLVSLIYSTYCTAASSAARPSHCSRTCIAASRLSGMLSTGQADSTFARY